MAEATPRCTCPPNGALVFLGHLKTCPEVLVPEVRVTRYEVSCLPESGPDADLFTLVVEYRGNDRWAVTLRGASYDADGNRSWGPPGDKEPETPQEIAEDNRLRDEWLAAHRFDEKTALDLAARLAPALHYRGYTVADALAQEESDA